MSRIKVRQTSLPLVQNLTSTPARPRTEAFNLPESFEDMSPILPHPTQKRSKSMLPVRITAVKPSRVSTSTQSATNVANGHSAKSHPADSTTNGPAGSKRSLKQVIVVSNTAECEIGEAPPLLPTGRQIVKPSSQPESTCNVPDQSKSSLKLELQNCPQHSGSNLSTASPKSLSKSVKKVPEPPSLKIDTALSKSDGNSTTVKKVSKPKTLKTDTALVKCSHEPTNKLPEPLSLAKHPTVSQLLPKALTKPTHPSSPKVDTVPSKPSPKSLKNLPKSSSPKMDVAPLKQTPKALKTVPKPSKLVVPSASASPKALKKLPKPSSQTHTPPSKPSPKSLKIFPESVSLDVDKASSNTSPKSKHPRTSSVDIDTAPNSLKTISRDASSPAASNSKGNLVDPTVVLTDFRKSKSSSNKVDGENHLQSPCMDILKNPDASNYAPTVWDLPRKQKKSLSLKKKSSIMPPTNNTQHGDDLFMEVIGEESAGENEDLSPFYIPEPAQKKRKTYVIKKKTASPENDDLDRIEKDIVEKVRVSKRGRTLNQTKTEVKNKQLLIKKSDTSSVNEVPLQNLTGPITIQAQVHTIPTTVESPSSTTKNTSETDKNVENSNGKSVHDNNPMLQLDVDPLPLDVDPLPLDVDPLLEKAAILNENALPKESALMKKRGRPKKTVQTAVDGSVAEVKAKPSKRKPLEKIDVTVRDSAENIVDGPKTKVKKMKIDQVSDNLVEELTNTDLPINKNPKKVTKRKSVVTPKKIDKKLSVEKPKKATNKKSVKTPKTDTKTKAIENPKKSVKRKSVDTKNETLEMSVKEMSNTDVAIPPKKRKTMDKKPCAAVVDDKKNPKGKKTPSSSKKTKSSFVHEASLQTEPTTVQEVVHTTNHLELNMNQNPESLSKKSNRKRSSEKKNATKKDKNSEDLGTDQSNKPTKGKKTKSTDAEPESSKIRKVVKRGRKMSEKEHDVPLTIGETKETVSEPTPSPDGLRMMNRKRSQSREPEEILIDERHLYFGRADVESYYPAPGVVQENHLWVKGLVGAGKLILDPGAKISYKKTTTLYTLIKGEVRVRIYDLMQNYTMESVTKMFFIPKGASFSISNNGSENAEVLFSKFA